MDRETESNVRAIVRKHLDRACDEIAAKEVIADMYWTAGHGERLAEQVTQSIALMSEVYTEHEE